MEKMLTTKEVAEILNVTYLYVGRMARQGKIPGSKLCKGTRAEWRFSKKDLERYLLENQNV